MKSLREELWMLNLSVKNVNTSSLKAETEGFVIGMQGSIIATNNYQNV